jgi:DNA-binding transcriptional MerR regulator
MTYREIEAELRVGKSTISYWSKTRNIKSVNRKDRDDLKTENIINLFNKGLSLSAIAKELQTSPSTISSRLKKVGIIQEKTETISDYGNVRIRRSRVKLAAIKYKGGECSICHKVFHPACMEFHHTDRDLKLYNVGSNMAMLSWEEIKKELDKCILTCANCHRELHANNESKFWDLVYKYNGTLDIGDRVLQPSLK